MVKKNQYTREAANVIRELMKRQGVSRSELARRLDVSPSYVTQVLSDSDIYTNSVSPSTLEKFANVLNQTLVVSVTPLPIQKKSGSGKLVPKKGGKNV